ncbi:MAG: tetratricopeptide repeat protein [bacterium]
MLNYILPPIIIIISVSILIVFLFRKAAQIPAGELSSDEHIKRSEKNSVKFLTLVGHFSLKILERMMHQSKLFSLKLHNTSNSWFQTIREKRQRSIRAQKELEEQKSKQIEMNQNRWKNFESKTDDAIAIEEEISRPMIKAKVTMPQQVTLKEKNQLEDALIKRIAMNPKDIEAYERLGDYYLENQNFQDSLECFKQVLKLSPAHHKARLRIRRLERMK